MRVSGRGAGDHTRRGDRRARAPRMLRAMPDATARAHAESLADPPAFWARAAEDIEWVRRPRAVWDDSDPLRPSWFPGAMLNTCYNAVDLPRRGRARRADRADLRQPGDGRAAHVQLCGAPGRGRAARGRAARARRRARRPRADLHADGARGGVRDARVRADRRDPLGGVRRLRRERARAADPARGADRGADRVVRDRARARGARTSRCSTRRSRARARSRATVSCCSARRPRRRLERRARRRLAERGRARGAGRRGRGRRRPIRSTSSTPRAPRACRRAWCATTAATPSRCKWSLRNVYGMAPGDVFWAASDIGWVVGHSYIVYAPLLLGCTTVLYEGKPVGTPDAGAFFRVIEQHRVNALFTAPTAIRAIKREDPRGELAEALRHVVAAHAVPGRRARRPRHRRVERARARRARDRPLVADRDRLADRRQLHGHRAACP